MTVPEARKTIGKTAEQMSDEQVQSYIDTADMLKMLFFESIKNKKTFHSNRDYEILSPNETKSSHISSSV